MKYFIVSQPKSGTYLLSAVLAELGLTQTNMHINTSKYQLYTDDLLDGRTNPENYIHRVGINQSLKLIPDNGFAVGHLRYTPKNIQALSQFKVILLTRPIHEARASMDRFKAETGRKAKFNENLHNNIEQWKETAEISVQFNQLIDGDTDAIDNIQEVIHGQVRFNSADVLNAAKNKETLTKSKHRR